ncbi:MAG: hypothetical protein ACYCWA_10415 [Thiobacillus sp.]
MNHTTTVTIRISRIAVRWSAEVWRKVRGMAKTLSVRPLTLAFFSLFCNNTAPMAGRIGP